jgi:hypothetical protein
VEGARRLRLVILDACRDNPFVAAMSRAGGTRAIGRGLARVEPVGNTLVAYAAKEGTTADDGEGRNSPYTAALLGQLEEPGLEINMLFRRVRDDVVTATGSRQEPFVYGSLSSEAFYFIPPSDEPAAPAAVAETPPQPPAGIVQARPTGNKAAFELAFWDTIKDSTDPTDFEAYLARYPNGNFAPLAQNRLGKLRQTEVVSVVPPPRPDIEVEVRDEVLIALRNANVRMEPATDSPKLETLQAGQQVTVTGKVRGKDWYRIERPGGRSGYVYAQLLGVRPERPEAPATATVTTPPPPSGQPQQVSLAGLWRGPEGMLLAMNDTNYEVYESDELVESGTYQVVGSQFVVESSDGERLVFEIRIQGNQLAIQDEDGENYIFTKAQ